MRRYCYYSEEGIDLGFVIHGRKVLVNVSVSCQYHELGDQMEIDYFSFWYEGDDSGAEVPEELITPSMRDKVDVYAQEKLNESISEVIS
jgi:hypothetical protein